MAKYYKVVTEDNKSLCYEFAGLKKSKYPIQYKVGKFVEPSVKNTKLYCFSSLFDAKFFISRLGVKISTRIYSCEVKNPGRPKFLAESIDSYLENFWNAKNKGKKVSPYNSFFAKTAPLGTVSCDAIKLLEEIT